MNKFSGRCPICGQEMTIVRLHCRACDSALEGNFEPTRFARLSLEQLEFLETFVRCQGKLNWVGDELGLSYPTVRSRLNDVIRALGFEIMDEPPAETRQRSVQQRQIVLEDLAAGKISAEEAITLLQGER
jgi:hypothetical protein